MKLFRSFLIVALAEPHRSDSWTLRLSDSPILGFSIDGLSDLRTLRLSDSPTLGLLDALYSSSFLSLFSIFLYLKFHPYQFFSYPTLGISDSRTLRFLNSRMNRHALNLTSNWMWIEFHSFDMTWSMKRFAYPLSDSASIIVVPWAWMMKFFRFRGLLILPLLAL